jgi:hypothetical protein
VGCSRPAAVLRSTEAHRCRGCQRNTDDDSELCLVFVPADTGPWLILIDSGLAELTYIMAREIRHPGAQFLEKGRKVIARMGYSCLSAFTGSFRVAEIAGPNIAKSDAIWRRRNVTTYRAGLDA